MQLQALSVHFDKVERLPHLLRRFPSVRVTPPHPPALGGEGDGRATAQQVHSPDPAAAAPPC